MRSLTRNYFSNNAGKLTALFCFMMLALQAQAATYTYTSGSFTNVSKWKDGSNNAATTFANAGDIFILPNGSSATLNQAWTIAGKLEIVGTLDLSHQNGILEVGAIDVNGGTFTQNNGVLRVLGTFTNSGTVSLTGGEVIYAAASGTQNVPGFAYNNLTISGSGTKELLGAATINGSLNLTGGALTIGNHDLTIGSAGSITGASASNYVKVGDGQLIMNVGATAKIFPVGTSTVGTSTYTPATITNAGTVQNFSVGVVDGIAGVVSTDIVNKTWNVTPAGTGANISLTLQWNGVDQGAGFSPSNCILSHYDQTLGRWESKGNDFGAASGTGPYTLTRNNITSFSPFGVGGPNSPLPVELVSFNATKKNAEVALTWETASEKNNTGFEIQTSNDGKNYEAVAFVASKNGNSTATQRYAFNHKNGSKEGLVYYRLKQIDMDGTIEYSHAKAVDLGKITSVVKTFPNPFRNQFELNLQAAATETAEILVTDMTGKTVYATKQNLQKGNNNIIVELNNAPAGIYLLKTTAGGHTYTSRLVKQ